MKDILKIILDILNIFKTDKIILITIIYASIIVLGIHYCTKLSIEYMKNKTKRITIQNTFFRKDGEGNRRILDDIIDSQEKLQSIIGNRNIEQSVNTPELWASVGLSDDKLYIVKKSKIESMSVNFRLANVEYHDYVNEGYRHIPNSYLETGNLDIMVVQNNSDMNNIKIIHANTPIANIKFIEIGFYLVMNRDNSLYISDTENWDFESTSSIDSDRLTMEDFLVKNKVEIEHKKDLKCHL